MSPPRKPYPVPGVIWASLPLPALLLDAEARIVEVNPAAENFFNLSDKALRGQPAFDRLAINAPIEDALARARANRAPNARRCNARFILPRCRTTPTSSC